jgi:hypothetical protein
VRGCRGCEILASPPCWESGRISGNDRDFLQHKFEKAGESGPILGVLAATMAITVPPRSVSEATRFTASTPQPASKAAASPSSRFASPPASASGGDWPPPRRGQGVVVETPEERVKRLRAAHDAAKRAKVSWFDRYVVESRGFFDKAHRFTVFGLIGFTGKSSLSSNLSVTSRYIDKRCF